MATGHHSADSIAAGVPRQADERKVRKRLPVVIEAVAVAVAAVLLYFIIFDALYVEDALTATTCASFYDQEEDTDDVVGIGSSNLYTTINIPMAFHEAGFAQWNIASGAQPFTAAKDLIQEAEKTQDPKLYIINLQSVHDLYNDPVVVRRVSINMPRSLNRVEAIRNMMRSLSPEDTTSFWDYYFVYPFFHNKWTELKWTDFFQAKRANESRAVENVYSGFTNSTYDASDWHNSLIDDPTMYFAAPQPLPEDAEAYLRELLEYCQTLGKDVLFLAHPSVLGEEHYGMINYAIDIIESYGFDGLNASMYMDEMGLKIDEDFWDGGHMNAYGAAKFTKWFCGYLKEHYDLPDHRGEEKYQLWEDNYATDRRQCIQGSVLLHHYMDTMAQDGYDGLLLWSEADPMDKETAGLLELIPELDIEQCRGRQLAIRLENGAVAEYRIGETAEISAPGMSGYAGDKECVAVVNGGEYRCRKGGVLGVVYDADTGELIDQKAFYADWERDLFSSLADGKTVVPDVQEELDAGWTDRSALQMLGAVNDELMGGHGFYPKENNIYVDCVVAFPGRSCDEQTMYVEFENSEGLYRAYRMSPVERVDMAQLWEDEELYRMCGAGVSVDYNDIPIGTYRLRLFREENGDILYSNLMTAEVTLDTKPYLEGIG